MLTVAGAPAEAFVEDFDDTSLNESVWSPHYLPMWSSRDQTRASYRIVDSALTLDIPVDHGLWCAEEHPAPLRLSGIQSGNHSGPVGSDLGQQPIFPGQRVREEQERLEGLLISEGFLEVRCRMVLSHRSMAAFWICGFEDSPQDSGEICVTEIFGKDVEPGVSAEVGMGIKPIYDPRLSQDFTAPRLPIDVAGWHTYAVQWDFAEAVFSVDGQVIRTCPSPPAYPMQLMVAVFDFPDDSVGGDDHLVPELVVDRLTARAR